jgi:hypothetical protein
VKQGSFSTPVSFAQFDRASFFLDRVRMGALFLDRGPMGVEEFGARSIATDLWDGNFHGMAGWLTSNICSDRDRVFRGVDCRRMSTRDLPLGRRSGHR